MSRLTPDVERFVVEHFDSEEAVMLLLALRADSPATVSRLLDTLQQQYGIGDGEERRVAEKRLELRLEDLMARGLVHAADGAYRYVGTNAGVDAHVSAVATLFSNDRAQLNRLIYSTSSRARRLAEAFRL